MYIYTYIYTHLIIHINIHTKGDWISKTRNSNLRCKSAVVSS